MAPVGHVNNARPYLLTMGDLRVKVSPMSRTRNRGLFAAARDVDDISREHLMCRDLGHQWVPYSVERVSQRRHWREVLACTRCTTYRTRYLNDRGEVVSSSYVYADGYSRVGQGAWTADLRASVRIAALQLMFDTDTVPTAAKGA